MNILLGKIGQKIIFNRDSKDCDRSNTNGNVGTYLLFKLLIENNEDYTFFVASDNDLFTFDVNPFKNVVDVSLFDHEYINKLNIDVMIVLTGLTQFEKDNRFIDILNNVDAKLMLLSDDPRCLDSVSDDERITRKPDLIISQFDGVYNFKGTDYHVKYEPIERASCYKCDIFDSEKEIDMVIVSNTSGKEYDRVKIVSEIIGDTSGLDIYGRLSDDERVMLGEDNCRGEIKYTEMQKVFRKAYSTFVVPIKKGWVTSKYVESLMNGVLPIFHEDYNTELLEANDLIIVRNKDEFADALDVVKYDKQKVKELVRKMTDVLIKPYVSGARLSYILMCYACLLKYREEEVKR